jgi:hypothetical protein
MVKQVNRVFQATAKALAKQLQADSSILRTIRQVLQTIEQVRSQRQNDRPGAEQVAARDLIMPERLARLLAERYAADRTLFPLWESYGFHVTPVHFYSPLPQVSALSEALWARPSELVGIDLNVPAQLQFLEHVCRCLQAEYSAFPSDPTEVPHQYYFNQPMFRSVDAEVLYCMIRHYHPQRVLEVGSGFSTYVSAAAVRQNITDGHPTTLVAIEPYPNDVLRHGFPGLSQLLQQPVQQIDFDLFTSLAENDILFIDSSHVLHINSDVRFLILEVLPRLQPGVLVHFHDIFLPCDYPRDWVMNEYRFWNEQYMLQAFLAFYHSFEVLWSGSSMHIQHSEQLREVFRSYDPATAWPGSFWIRRRTV